MNIKQLDHSETLNMSKVNNPNYILNPETNRYVKRNGAIGKGLIEKKMFNQLGRPPDQIHTRPLCKDQQGWMCISVLDKLGNSQGLRLSHCVDGLKQIKSVLLDAHPDNEHIIKKTCSVLLATILILKRKEKYVTLGSVQNTKWTIFQDKSVFLNITTLTTVLLPMLVRVCLGRDRAFVPYWNNAYKELSLKLWLPNQIDCQDSQPNSLNTSSQYVDANSWFTIKQSLKTPNSLKNNNSSTMSSQSCMSILADSMVDVGEPLKHKEQLCTRKVKLFPSPSMRKILREWMRAARVTYNNVIWNTRHHQELQNLSFYDLRQLYVNAHLFQREKPDQGDRSGAYKLNGRVISKKRNENVSDRLFVTPKDIRAGAIQDYIGAKKAAFTNLKNGNIQQFKMRYRKGNTSIRINKSCLSVISNGKYINMYPSRLKRILVAKCDRPFLSKLQTLKDCRLKIEYGHWYLCVPYMKSVEQQVHSENKICAIDPGIRKMYTVFDGDRILEIEHNIALQKQLQRKLDYYQSLRSRKKIVQRSYRRRRERIQRKWNCRVNDMHYKVASMLVSQYKYIGLPPFETSKMVKGNQLSSKIKRDMLGLKHFQLKQRIRSVARGHSYIYNVDESYTTQCCTRCGNLKHMGSNDVYKCKECGLSINRDIGSARSIFMCFLQKRFI